MTQGTESCEISTGELKSLYDRNQHDFILIDVREAEEFRDWRIYGSVNVPLGHRFVNRVRTVAEDNQVIAVCRTGVRSLHAVDELEKAGLSAKSLRGGMVAWSNTYVSNDVQVSGKTPGRVVQIRRLSKGCASYIVSDGKECAVIDPSSRIDEYVGLAATKDFRITHVIDTHKHADHISGGRALASATGAELHLSPLDSYHFEGYRPLLDKHKVGFENGDVEIEAIHTPGHTPGSMSLLINHRLLLSGDTLFLDGIGRPDLQGSTIESAAQLYNTCRKMFAELDSDTTVLPAHFSPQTDLMTTVPIRTTISGVKQKAAEVNLSDREMVRKLVQNLPKPANHEAILRINSGQDTLDLSLVDLLEEGHNRCSFPLGLGDTNK